MLTDIILNWNLLDWTIFWALTLFSLTYSTVIVSLFVAGVLLLVMKWPLKKQVTYVDSYTTVFFSGLINTALSVLVGLIVLLGFNLSHDALVAAASLTPPVAFLVHSKLISAKLSTGFGKACSASLIMTLIGICITIILFIPLLLHLVLPTSA